jgi:hypothetical protein
MTELFNDPTPDGLINMRVMVAFVQMFEFTTLTGAEKARLLDLLALVARKLVGVWRHLDAFRTIEDELAAQEESRDLAADVSFLELRYSQDLFLEFDGFLVQLKSALDYLVKVPVPIVGGNRWKLRSFGERGEAVFKAVKGCLSAKDRSRMVPYMYKVLEMHRPWLKEVIDARDRTNHFLDGGIPYEQFLVRKIRRKGVEGVCVPMWSDSQQLRSAMEAIWVRLVSLVEDFVGGFIGLRLRDGFALFHAAVPDGVPQTCWRVVPSEVMDRQVAGPQWRLITEEDVTKEKDRG